MFTATRNRLHQLKKESRYFTFLKTQIWKHILPVRGKVIKMRFIYQRNRPADIRQRHLERAVLFLHLFFIFVVIF